MYDVFISYSRADYKDPETGELLPNSPVSLVKELLDELGVRYWIDEKGIYSGSQFMNEIAEAIDKSRIFLFISTENSNKSQWVERELAFAVEQNKFILPIKAVDKYPPKISIWLASHDYIDHYKQPKQTVARLKEAITRRLEEMRTREELEVVLKRLSFEIAEQQKVDGIICLSYNSKLQVSENVPMISIDRYFGAQIPCVASDNYGGGALAAQKF